MASIDQLRSGQTYSTQRSAQEKPGASRNSGSEASSTSSSPRSDAVSLSAQGKSVGQIHQQLAAEPSFDSAKVASIKEAISNGSYVIDADRLASNMMQFEEELRGF
ncbi:flagellar biosynthesis anti-sigma factor FlgM [Thaumasiovibrio subtropicus]|uniref:flagellar biosynthesis anti-sigma factor FlgM n=1 Tax=Thaumasiovibrio subtropicus TaxID=1891207 RepID=UPI000B34D95B|nr:flagellar biosynthesis anti-sigma factor FlgM [Thaumasiovibrio subtropicus]